MDITICAGKGGVGKSTSAAALSLAYAEQGSVLAIDYDGGKALSRAFSLPVPDTPNSITATTISGLHLASIQPHPFQPIEQAHNEGINTQDYLAQFPGDYGNIPLHDMAMSFYGILTDVDTVSHFATLTRLFEEAGQQGIEHIILDVEPTTGLQKMLRGRERLARSMRNLQSKGRATLMLLGLGAPDIKASIESPFIQQADHYGERIIATGEALTQADYFLVCNPEPDVVSQLIEDVYPLVTQAGATIKGYIVNIKDQEQPDEQEVARISQHAQDTPLLHLGRDQRLRGHDTAQRRVALLERGRQLLMIKNT